MKLMEIQDHHEKLFTVLAVLVGVTTVTNLMLTQRADQLEQSVAKLRSQIYQMPQETLAPSIPSVSINTLSQASGYVGDRVQITGSGFMAIGNQIHFGSAILFADSPDGVSLAFAVPGFLSSNTRTQPIAYFVTVENIWGISNAMEFTVKP